MKEITKEELDEGFEHYLTVGKLLDYIEKYNISRDAKVLTQRVEDVYYNKYNWGVVLGKGFHYYSIEKMNQNMIDEENRRKLGKEPEYDMEDPSMFIVKLDDSFKDQYSPVWGPVRNNDDKDNLYLNLHY